MIRDSYVALAQEPWCFTPAQIAKLTDWQIEELYLKPAAERAEKWRRERPGAAAAPPSRPEESAPDHEPGTPEHRRQIVEDAFIGQMGMGREKAEALYEKQLRQWKG